MRMFALGWDVMGLYVVWCGGMHDVRSRSINLPEGPKKGRLGRKRKRKRESNCPRM